MKYKVLILILFVLNSCHDGTELAVPGNKDIYKNNFYKAVYYNGIQIKELLIKTEYKFDLSSGLYGTKVEISNPNKEKYSNSINALDCYAVGSSTELKITWPFNDSKNEKEEFYLGSNPDLTAEKLIIYPVIFKNDSSKNYSFSSVYLGEYKLLNQTVDSIIDFGRLEGVISADGILDFNFSGNLDFERLNGSINSQKDILAKLNSKESTDKIEFKNSQNNSFVVNSDTLDISLDVSVINSKGIYVLKMVMKKQKI